MEQNKPIARKVKTGCLTCKLRRVKCDESKPVCLRCRKAVRQCLGYGITPARAVLRRHSSALENSHAFNPLVNNAGDLAITIPGNAAERGLFDFFSHRTLHNVSGGFHCSFWEKDVFQMSAVEPAVRHAVVALASIHEAKQSNAIAPPTFESAAFTTSQYLKSLNCLQQRMTNGREHNLGIILACCILFTACEVVRGEPTAAMSHLRNGLKIISEHAQPSRQPGPDKSAADDLIPVFLRLNIQARSLLRPALPEYFHLTQTFPPHIPETFSSLTQARDVMATIYNKGYSVFASAAARTKPSQAENDQPARSREGSADKLPPHMASVLGAPDPERVRGEIARLITMMNAWQLAFDRLVKRLANNNPQRNLSNSDLQGATLLRIHCLIAHTVLGTCRDITGLAFDGWIEHFRKIVSLAGDLINLAGWEKDPHFSLDMGVIPPLYSVATMCRDPWIRRDAIRLLQKMGARKEGAWDARVAANVGEWFVGVEEGWLSAESGIWSSPSGSIGQSSSSDELNEFSKVPEELWIQGRAFVTLGTLAHSRSVLQGKLGSWRANGSAAREYIDESGEGLGVSGDDAIDISILNPPPGVVPRTVKRIQRLHAEVETEKHLIRLVPLFNGQSWEMEV